MRIQHNPMEAYNVVYNLHRGLEPEGPHPIQQEDGDSSTINTIPYNKQIQESTHHLATGGPLKEMYTNCLTFFKFVKFFTTSDRSRYLQGAANARHYYSIMVEEIERLDQAGVKTQVDGKDQKQIFEELRNIEKQVPEWDYQNVCCNMLNRGRTKWDNAISSLFIALPSDLDSWNDVDSSTHQFRLYFLCDNWKRGGALKGIDQHVHLSNHPGYSIKRPQEFFQLYGSFIQRMLQMVKYGYSESKYEIPPLDTFKILWNCDPNVIDNHFSEHTLGRLVDKAIAYLQELSPPKAPHHGLTRDQLAAIKNFLDMQEGDTGESNLNRYVTSDQVVLWMCESHVHQRFEQGALKDLRKFVLDQGGHVDTRHSTLRVELRSETEADQFCSLHTAVKHVFDISVKLCWKATRSYVKNFFVDIAKMGTVVLEIDGITQDMNPQGHIRYTRNLFSDDVFQSTSLQFVTLLNYPRHQEQCIQFERFLLQSTISPVRLNLEWVNLREDLNRIFNLVRTAQVESDCSTAVGELQKVLEKHRLADVTTVTVYNDLWDAVFDLEKRAIVEVASVDMYCPKAVLSSGSLRKVTVNLDHTKISYDFFRMVQTNNLLQELNISYGGHNVLSHTEHILRMWRDSSISFGLTLLDRMVDSQGRIFAHLNRVDSELPENRSLDLSINPSTRQHQATDGHIGILFLEWDCEHIFGQLSDYSASFVDMATQQHPTVLTLFTLDASRLTCNGLASVKNILSRSSLEHLHVICTRYDPSVSESITQVLSSVPWLTLKSLVVSGDKIDEWLKLWPLPIDSRLLCLQIRGAGDLQDLSHSCVLLVHQMVSSGLLIELHLRNVQLQDERDWTFLVESLDSSPLKILDMGWCSMNQLLSAKYPTDIFCSRINEKGAEAARLDLPGFTLDVAALTEQGLVNTQKLMRGCTIRELHIQCPAFDRGQSLVLSQVLDSLLWSTVEILNLSGDNINQWIQLLTEIDAPQLKFLDICGTDLEQQELSHSSVLFIQRLISKSMFERLLIAARLQDEQDWVLIVESLDPVPLKSMVLGNGSHEQFMSTKNAVDLFASKTST